MIAAWLGNKTFQMVVAALAALALVTFPVALVQTVRLDGVSFFGWHLVAGALAVRDKALDDLRAERANAASLQGALDLQNAKIAALGAASAAAQARAAQALSHVRNQNKAAAALEDRLLAAKPGRDLCQSADALILETVK